MRWSWLLLGTLIVGCDSTVEGPISWFDGWIPNDLVDLPLVSGAHRITIEHPQGAMSFDALDEADHPVLITGGLTWYGEASAELMFTDGDALYAFVPDVLRITKVTDWVDAFENPVEVLGIHRLSVNGSPVIMTRESAQVRVYDVATQTLSTPVAMIESNPNTGELSPFTPTTFSYVPSFKQAIGYSYLAIGRDGGLFVGREERLGDVLAVIFINIQPVQRICSTGEVLPVDHLIASNLPDGSQQWPETIIGVSGDQQFILTDTRCYQPAGTVMDDNQDAIEPLGGFDLDLELDGFDTVVWVHR